MNNTLYKIKNLTKRFSNNGYIVNAINGIDLNIKKGETVGIKGVSGSGKSTLLHIMGALDSPTGGEVLYNEENLFIKNETSLSEFRNNEIGFVFQFHYLLPEFSALENVMMPCLIRRVGKDIAEQKAFNILKNLGLEDRVSHKPGELSGGEQQRVSIARAMVLNPKVILADEPTGNLDLKTGLSILEIFLKLNEEQGITSVVVTHNLEIAHKLQRTITISDGIIVNEH
ncbi:MAG: ABC transporter ATP-binding protein [Thermodesulfobacteriota bacterium]